MTSLGRAAGLAALILVWPSGAHAHDDVHGTIETLSEHLDVTPDDVQTLLERGDAHRHLGDYQAAIGDLTSASELAPGDARIDLNLGRVYAAMGEAEPGIAHLTAYIDATGGSLLAYWLRAELHHDEGRLADALRDIDAALAIAHNVDAHAMRAAWLADADRLDEALAGLQAALDQTGSTALRVRLFEHLVDAREYTRASDVAADGAAAARVPTRWLLREARAASAAGDEARAARVLAEAREHADRAVARRDSCANRAERARVRHASGLRTDALEDARVALARCPSDLDVAALRDELGGLQ